MPEPITVVEGKVAPLEANDVDTDQIIPAQFLKVLERKGLGRYLFYRWRFDERGESRPEFVLNRPEFKDAVILAAGENFGIGSSRENAVWALLDYGIRVVLATSFGDIFYTNSTKNGLVCIQLPGPELADIREAAKSGNLYMRVDVVNQTLSYAGKVIRFEMEPNVKEALVKGLDEVELTLSKYGRMIEEYERRMPRFLYPKVRRLITD